MVERAWGSYFSIVSVLLLVLSIIAFSDNLFTDVGQASNRDPKFVVHGLFGLAWYVLLVVQANLARVRNLRVHRRVGIATLLVAIGVTLSTLYIFVVLWKGWDLMAPDVRANRLFLPGYALCLWLAWTWRGQPDRHKRLVLIATFFMLGPVLLRAYDPLVATWLARFFPEFNAWFDPIGFQLFLWGTWVGLFLSLLCFDWRMLRRLHAVSLAGIAWFALVWLLSTVT